jgi:hypothetical protein
MIAPRAIETIKPAEDEVNPGLNSVDLQKIGKKHK